MKKRNKQLLTLLLIAFIASFLAATVLKLVFKVPRPCDGFDGCPSSFSFPSRHSSVVFALGVVLIANIERKDLQLGVLVVAVIVALSRVIFNYHTYTDIAGGMVVGVVVGIAVQKAFKVKK